MEWSLIPQVYIYLIGLLLIGALATTFLFLFLSSRGSASRGVHHNFIGLKVLEEMAKSREFAL